MELISGIPCLTWLISTFAFALAIGSSSGDNWKIAGSRAEGWYSTRITADMNLSSDIFGSTYTSLGAVPCTKAHVLGATFPSMLLPVAPQSGTPVLFSMVAAVHGGALQLVSEQSNGQLASLQGLKLSLTSSQGELIILTICLPSICAIA